MLPVQVQLHFESEVSALSSLIVTTGEPGDQGAGMTGTHGIGVSTPCAAAVAEATCGFACVLHIPKGAMFVMGTLSMTVAVGCSSALDPLAGRTVSVEGALPWLHLSFAPFATSFGMGA